MATPLMTMEFDHSKLEAVLRRVRHIPGALKRIVPRALNSAIISARDSGSVYNLVLQRLEQNLPVPKRLLKRRFFGNRAKAMKWEASVRAGQAGFGLGDPIAYRASRAAGVTIPRIIGRTIRLPSAFEATMPTGHTGVYMRKGHEKQKWNWRTGQTPYALVPRHPIGEIKTGPAVEDVWKEVPEIAREVAAAGRRRLERTIYIETENEIVKRMPK